MHTPPHTPPPDYSDTNVLYACVYSGSTIGLHGHMITRHVYSITIDVIVYK